MNTSQAFSASFKYVTESTSYFFNFGHPRSNPDDSILIVGLVILGQLARVFIGFPLGFIAGCFAAGFTALSNLFKSNVLSNKIVNEVATDLEVKIENAQPSSQDKIAEKPAEKNKPFISVEKIMDPVAIIKDTQPIKLSNEHFLRLEFAQKSAEITRKSFAEKKRKLISSINLLTQFIAQKLTTVQSFVQFYEDSQQRIEGLKKQLNVQNNIAISAQKFSHNHKEIDYKVSCACGLTCHGFKCNYCNSPVFRKEIPKTTPIYIADTAARQVAQAQSQTLSLALAEEINKYPQPAEYETKKQLVELNYQLPALLSKVKTEERDLNLLSLLSQFKKILSKAKKQFLTADDLKKFDFVPKSDYAQHYVAVKMMQQLTRQNGLDLFGN